MEERQPETSPGGFSFVFGPEEDPRRALVTVRDGVLAICYEKENVVFASLGPEPDGKTRRIEIRYREQH